MKIWLPVLSIAGGICGIGSGLMVGMAGGMFGNGSMAESGSFFYLNLGILKLVSNFIVKRGR
jgi:hypothetical protein